VIVTNEVGLGIVPADPLSRRYGEALGRTNARLASACDEVVLMVAGLPLSIKSPR
jgi:adenosylcobinamide kinase/adenosylcobinamide-phosphate guanylyltransferase